MKYTVNSDSNSKLTDEQFIARLSALDDMLDCMELVDSDTSSATQDDVNRSLEELNSAITLGIISDSALEVLIEHEPGLSTFGSSENLTEFKKNLNKTVVSNEGKLDGFLGDMNTGLIGMVIAMIRNKLPNLKEQVGICKNKLMNASDDKISERSSQAFIRVRSKYLPAYDVYMKAVAALQKVLDTISSDVSADSKKLTSFLTGTMYWNPEKMKKTGNQDTNWSYALIRLLPAIANIGVPVVGTAIAIAERFWYEPSAPVGERGWTSRKSYTDGLNALEKLISSLDKATNAIMSKNDKASRDSVEMLRWAQKEVIYIGRGLTTAIRKVYAGGFVRFFSNRFIH